MEELASAAAAFPPIPAVNAASAAAPAAASNPAPAAASAASAASAAVVAASAAAVVDVGVAGTPLQQQNYLPSTNLTPQPGYEESTECRELVDKIPGILQKLAEKRKALQHEQKRSQKKYRSTLSKVKKAEELLKEKHTEMQEKQKEMDLLKAAIAKEKAAVEKMRATAKKLEEALATEHETGFDAYARLGVFVNSLHNLDKFVTSLDRNQGSPLGQGNNDRSGSDGSDDRSGSSGSDGSSGSSGSDGSDGSDDDGDPAEDDDEEEANGASGASSVRQVDGRRVRKNSVNPFSKNWKPLKKWYKWMHKIPKETWKHIYNHTDCQKCRGQLGLTCEEMPATRRRGVARGGCVAAKKLLADAKAKYFQHPTKGKRRRSKRHKK